MKLRPWHRAKKGEYGLRLVNDPSLLGWVDLCWVDNAGEKLGVICSFSTAYGHVITGEYGRCEHPTKMPVSQIEQHTGLYYKIWHNKHKANVRLRIRYSLVQDAAIVYATDKHGHALECASLIKVWGRGHGLYLNIFACGYVASFIDVPMTPERALYVEV